MLTAISAGFPTSSAPSCARVFATSARRQAPRMDCYPPVVAYSLPPNPTYQRGARPLKARCVHLASPHLTPHAVVRPSSDDRHPAHATPPYNGNVIAGH
jgi:hypothetical protein